MSRLLGPDPASRLITLVTGSNIYEFSGRRTTIYTDAAGTQPASIAAYDPAAPLTAGATIAGSAVTLDGSSRLPLFWFPDGVDTLYARPVGGPLVQINADYDRRLDNRPDSTWVNAAQFGAVGDDATNCTTAIQAAIDSLPAAGGTVYLPAGIYRTSGPVTVRSGLSIVGDGDGATVIAPKHTTGSTLVGVDITRLTVTGVWIEGTGTSGGTGISLTLSALPCTSYVNLTDVTVASVQGDGIAVENPIVSAFTRVIAQTCGGWGINLHGQPAGASGTSVSLISCYVNACGTGGMRLYKMSYCVLAACASDANPIGYLLDQAFNVSLTGCGGEGNTVNTVKVVGGYGNALRSLFCYANHGVAVWATSAASAVVIDQAIDVSPGGDAVNFIKVDAGCRATLVACNNTTANSIAAGTTSVLSDGAGNFAAAGAVSAGGSLTLGGDGVLSRPGAFTLRAENNLQVGSTLAHQGANAGFFNAAPIAQPAVTGAKGGNAALTSLIQKLAALGLISDSTT